MKHYRFWWLLAFVGVLMLIVASLNFGSVANAQNADPAATRILVPTSTPAPIMEELPFIEGKVCLGTTFQAITNVPAFETAKWFRVSYVQLDTGKEIYADVFLIDDHEEDDGWHNGAHKCQMHFHAPSHYGLGVKLAITDGSFGELYSVIETKGRRDLKAVHIFEWYPEWWAN